MECSVAFEYRQHALLVPVTTCGIETSFLLDTGAGLSLISDQLAARVGCVPDGSTYTGHRMSGQPLTIPLGRVGSLDLGTNSAHDITVGILDFPALAGLEGLGGMLSLSYFRSVPVTIDYQAGLVVIEDQASLERRLDAGTAVSVQVDYDGASTDLMLGIDLPGGRAIAVEVDTGSDTLILNESLAADAGVDLRSHRTVKSESKDETGNEFVRYFTTMSGDIGVTGAPKIRMSNPDVMFQKIIYDGLVGDRFLRNFTTTYDLANSRMIFAVP
jgi:hypothetical protein